MGAGNTSVLMQLLVGMLDAALARQQDLVPEDRRIAVALKVDEAPLVLNRGFAETMALKRSAGLETVACWQTDAQWLEREVRDQLDALFAHRVYFATASVRDARSAVGLTMSEFSDTIRPGIEHLAALGRPDARLHLPRHHAIASWSTPEGRQSPFMAETIPLRVDAERVSLHAERQAERGGRYRTDLRQPHWDHERYGGRDGGFAGARTGSATATASPHSRPDGISPLQSLPSEDRSERAPLGRSSPGGEESAESTSRKRAGSRGENLEVPGKRNPRSGGGGEGAGTAQSPSSGDVNEGTPPDSYRELVELDGAHSVRWAKRVAQPRSLEPEPLDLEILALVACMRHVLSSQIHRRFNPGRAATTTQRRLKRLSDAGLMWRFQFHRRDGGGVPMCYAITATGLEMLRSDGRSTALEVRDVDEPSGPWSSSASAEGARRLRQARHDVHVAGWVLAFVGVAPQRLRGASESVLSPPLRSTPNGRIAFGPLDLSLPGGRAPHDFLCTDPAGAREPVECFETVRPDVTIELPANLRQRSGIEASPSAPGGAGAAGGSIDLLVELDDRLPAGRSAGKLERYDHLLAGWSVHIKRYGPRRDVLPVVVFVCRDRARAREYARRADAVLTACRAYAGEYPADWEYPGRDRVLFVAERDVHEGQLRGYGVPPLPPEVRVSIAHGDPRAGESAVERRELPR